MMAGVALLLLALALVVVPTPSPAAARLGALRCRPPSRRRRLPGLPALRTAGIAVAAVGFAAAFAAAGHLADASPTLPAAAGAIVGGTAGLGALAAAGRRQRARRDALLVESVGALAADLRAGQHPDAALTTSALSDRAATGVGGSPQIAAVWAVSDRSGAPVANVLDRVEQDLRARVRQRREVASQLAGARSTAVLLAVLPLVGIGLGAAMGARPLAVLFGTSRGQLALVVGVGLDALGVLWTARIVANAGGET